VGELPFGIAPDLGAEAPERLRIRILGTGALASFLGARLNRAGFSVVLAGSWKEGLEALSKSGVIVEEEGGTWSGPLRAVPIEGPLEPADWVLVLAKSYQTAKIAPDACRNLLEGGRIVTFQNGLGNREILAAQAGSDRVVQGVATVGVTLLEPGRVRALDGRLLVEPNAVGLVAILREARLQGETTPDIERAVWRKLAVNCAINPLSALLSLKNGALLEIPTTRKRLFEVAMEVSRVAEARGTPLGESAAALVEEVARKTAENRSSMLQDLDRGGPTEIEALNGAVVREGVRLGVPTPLNAALADAIRRRAA
jgi:2-dehydropantoate 2-reductase